MLFFVAPDWQKLLDNNLGTKNNVVIVRESDFEVFEALAMDSVSTGEKGKIWQPLPTLHSTLQLLTVPP